MEWTQFVTDTIQTERQITQKTIRLHNKAKKTHLCFQLPAEKNRVGRSFFFRFLNKDLVEVCIC